MAARKPVGCMFCDPAPCACGKKPSRPRASSTKKSPPPVETKEPAPPPPPVEPSPVSVRRVPSIPRPRLPIKSGSTGAIQGGARPVRNVPLPQPDTEEENRMFRQALTALAPLLCAEDLEQHRDKIDLPSHRVDALIWRQSR